MAISTVDGWLAAGKQFLPFYQPAITGTFAAGNFVSLWRSSGGYPAQSAIPTSAAVPTDTDCGLIFANAAGGQQVHLGRLDILGAVTGQLILYDRLSHMGGLSGTNTAAQTVNTAAITRGDTSGTNVEGFLEWYTTTGVTATTVDVVYTDNANTSRSATGITLAASRPASLCIPIPWIGAANGIRSVQTVDLIASTGTTGNFDVTLRRRLATIPITANVPISLDPFALGLPPIENDACLEFLFVTSTTTGAGLVTGQIALGTG